MAPEMNKIMQPMATTLWANLVLNIKGPKNAPLLCIYGTQNSFRDVMHELWPTSSTSDGDEPGPRSDAIKLKIPNTTLKRDTAIK